jgi:hypothetical protein
MMCHTPCPPGSFLDGVACVSSCPPGTQLVGVVCEPFAQLPALGRQPIALLCTILALAGLGLLYERRRLGAG